MNPERKKIQPIVIAEVGDLEAQLRDTADAELGKEAEGSHWIVNLVRNKIFREVSRQWKINSLREEVSKTGDLFRGSEGSTSETLTKTERVRATVVNQFVQEYDEAIHREAGEYRNTLAEGGSEGELKREIKDLLKWYVSKAEITPEDDVEFQRAKSEILRRHSGLGTHMEVERVRAVLREKHARGEITQQELNERFNEETENLNRHLKEPARVYADNLLQIAKEFRKPGEHMDSMEAVINETQVLVGRAKAGVRTESEYTACDSILEKLRRTPFVGPLLNGPVGAAAFAGVYSLGVLASKSFARAGALAVTGFAGAVGVGGLVAGMTEHKRFTEQRTQHFRDVAKGKQFNPDHAPLRKEMQEFAYDVRDARTLRTELEDVFYLKDTEGGTRPPRALEGEELKQAFQKLAEVEARISLSDRHNIDLISYTEETEISAERLRLDYARAQIKFLYRTFDPESFALLDTLKEQAIEKLQGGDSGIREKDRLFKKMRAIKTGKAVMRGVGVGATLGVAFQGGVALGKVAFSLEHGDTVLGSLWNQAFGETPLMPQGNLPPVKINGREYFLPEGTGVSPQEGGTYTFFRHGEAVAEGLEVNNDGTFKLASLAKLEEHGITAIDQKIPGATQEAVAKEVSLSAKEFAQSEPSLFHRVHRVGWYDNDTPIPVVDGNEAQLHWGGIHGSGLDGEGNIVYSVKHMTPDGSFSRDFSANVDDLKGGGTLKMIFSLSRDSQTFVAECEINEDGEAIIPKDSDIANLFFKKTSDGHVEFLGKYAEVAHVVGVDENDVEQVRILATDVGRGINSDFTVTQEEVPPPDMKEITRFSVPEDISDEVEMLPFVPYWGRNELERVNNKHRIIEDGEDDVPSPYYGYGGYHGGAIPEKRRALYEGRRSEALKREPKGILDPRKEIKSYLEKESEEYKDKIAELARQAGPMDKKCKASICIPVAGHQEGKNIYESLENYTRQTANPEEYELVLFVNHPEKDATGKEIKPDETLEEIKRFQKNYSDIRVRVMYSALPLEDAKMGKIRKMLTDATILRDYRRGDSTLPELILISNDADNKGMSPRYVETFIKKFEAHPEIDGFQGQLDWDPESYLQYPAVHVGTRLFQYLGIIGRARSGGMVSSGANSAFRSGVYAGIGGYIDTLGDGEDIAIREAIVSARGGGETFGYAAGGTRLFTSSRRAINALKLGLAPAEQWDKGFSAFDDDIRRLSLEGGKKIDYGNEDAREKLKMSLERIIDRTLDVYERGEKLGKDSSYYKKAIGLLGIKYALGTDGRVIISDMDKLLDGLKFYQKEALLIKDAKTGDLEAVEELRSLRKERRELQAEILAEIKESQRKLEKEVDTRFEDFSKKDSLVFEKQSRQKIQELNNSSEKERIGGFVVCRDRVLSDKETRKVFFAYKPGSDTLYVAKQSSSGPEKVEEYLKGKNFADVGVRLPVEIVKDGDRLTRFYEAGGTDLERYLVAHNAFSPKESLSIMLNAAKSVKALHNAGIASIDLMPSNILLNTANSNNPRLMLIDLDNAVLEKSIAGRFSKKYLDANELTSAPELLQEGAQFDKTVDVYAIGSNLYRLIEGKWPYPGESRRLTYEERIKKRKALQEQGGVEFTDKTPAKIQKIIRRALEFIPAKRYQTISELMKDMLDAYEGI